MEAFTQQIREVLWRKWDPLGVNNSAEAQSDYDNYIDGVLDMLLDRQGERAIADYLLMIEQDYMALAGNYKRCQMVARDLVALGG